MPRLGNDDAGPGGNQPVASAYSSSNRQPSIPMILLMLFGFYTLRNVLFHDYRSEEVNLLKASGQSEDQIDKIFVRMTAAERRKKQMDEAKERDTEFERFRKDIDFLKTEVKLLRGAVGEDAVERIRKEKNTSSTTKS